MRGYERTGTSRRDEREREITAAKETLSIDLSFFSLVGNSLCKLGNRNTTSAWRIFPRDVRLLRETRLRLSLLLATDVLIARWINQVSYV